MNVDRREQLSPKCSSRLSPLWSLPQNLTLFRDYLYDLHDDLDGDYGGGGGGGDGGEGLPDGDDVGHDQDKKVLVADPDVLSFNVVDHKMQFAGVGSSFMSKIKIWNVLVSKQQLLRFKVGFHVVKF